MIHGSIINLLEYEKPDINYMVLEYIPKFSSK